MEKYEKKNSVQLRFWFVLMTRKLLLDTVTVVNTYTAEPFYEEKKNTHTHDQKASTVYVP